ncbi:Serine/threonine-protein kinase PknB [Nocardioides dokdonensis FR1436]|uniref:non-specific serine/threonine protein kinase n=1 Tax=Nocardioides dokdonensis FR1436 TaxID=1300347 RepID=A0A1A9GLS4_9ACTN|nr:Serine/threonine-protein kinase PknB [Nocardioides dokdonensis FR1436]
MAPELIAGRYRVERELGRGGMGAVWLCRDEMLGRQVAVKQIGALPGEAADLARALREARSSAALQHPNVVSVFDAIDEGETIWLVMEYVPSRTLSQLVRDDGPLDPRRAAGLGAQVAEGLALAHDRGTVHRDVKPGNVLVKEGDHAKISDFGIARSNTDDEHRTQTGLMTGTPAYFSPELARGADPTPASDVWALGATLYAAVEGRPPFPSRDNAIAMLMAIAHDRPEPPRHAGPLAGVLGHMLDPEPDARWSMARVARELRAVAGGRDDSGDRAAAATAPMTAVAPAVVPEPEPEPDPAPTPAATPAATPASAVGAAGTADRRRGIWIAVAAVVLLVLVALGGFALLGGSEDDQAPAADDSSATPEATGDPSDDTTASSAPTADGSSAAPEETEDPGNDADVSGSDAEGVVSDYYAALPQDVDTGWATLSPDLQDEIGRDSYDGFWATISSVSIQEVDDVGDGVVDVTLTYDGGSRETRRIEVGPVDGDLRILSDSVVG